MYRLETPNGSTDHVSGLDTGRTLIGTTRAARLGAANIDYPVAAIWVVVAAEILRPSIDLYAGRQPLTGGVVAVFLFLFYFFISEWAIGATPGKLFTGLTVRHSDGTKCGALAVFIRTIIRMVEVNPILFGCLPAALLIWRSKKHQRWGDVLADTVVIEKALLRQWPVPDRSLSWKEAAVAAEIECHERN